MREFAEIWSYLAEGPLLWLAATLIAYAAADALAQAAGRRPLVNPVLIAALALAVLLAATGTPYATYFEGAQFVHFLLGPATVALAVPLADGFGHVRRAALPILAALLAGSVTAMLTALGVARLTGITGDTLVALASKSATA